MGAPKFSVVIPFFNEEGNARALLDETLTAMARLDGNFEVLMVNDASRDRTAEILSVIAQADPRCVLLSNARNAGQAASLDRGFNAARGEWILTMDGDGQNDPADYPALWNKLVETGADMVVGVRANRKDSALRQRMSRIANAVRGRILRDGVDDSGCALKIFRREVVGSFLPMKTLYSFMPALAVAGGYKVVQAPVNHRPRAAGVSNYGLRVMLWRPLVDLLGVWWFTRRSFPVRRIGG